MYPNSDIFVGAKRVTIMSDYSIENNAEIIKIFFV